MPELATKTDAFADTYRRIAQDLPGASVAWAVELREAALKRFLDQGFPTTRSDAWKYTNVEPIATTGWTPSAEADATRVNTDAVARYLLPGSENARIIFVDGHLHEDLTNLSALPKGVRVLSLAKTLEEDPDLVKPYFAQYAKPEDDAFTALNAAFADDGAVVLVDRNVVCETPIHVLHVNTGTTRDLTTSPHNLVVAGESAEVAVVESHVGLDEARYFTNAVTEIIAGDNAVVDVHKVQREGPAAFHVGTSHASQGRDSTVGTYGFDLGGKLVRNNVHSTFRGEGAEAILYGLFALDGKQHVDNHTIIDHATPHCRSDELYKGVLGGESRGVFLGRIHVHPGAQKTDAYQHNPNLILSKGALVDSTPQLEIYADDVKCSHGSTIGQIEGDQVFYLQSRGLSEEQARALLTYAFARDIIDRVKIAPLRERLNDLLLERLPAGATIRNVIQ